jgi:hypothetical protein
MMDKEEDDINAWIYEANRDRPLREVFDDMDTVCQELLAVIKGLPDDTPIIREWRVVTLGDERFPAGEFFDHFRDDHEAEMRA